MTILWHDPSSNVVTLASRGRPYRPRIVQPENWFDAALHEANARVFGDERPCDSNGPEDVA